MRRIQGSFGSRSSEEEKRRVRESVIANFVLFGAFVAVIRAGNNEI